MIIKSISLVKEAGVRGKLGLRAPEDNQINKEMDIQSFGMKPSRIDKAKEN